MTTRLYFGFDAPIVSPTADASWESALSFVRRTLTTTKLSTATATEALAVATNSNTPAGAVDVVILQATSAPLSGNQTISGAIKGQMRMLESATAADLRVQCVIWVRKADGTSRGTLVASDASALSHEFDATTKTNRAFPLGAPVTPTTVNALDTDRIVVEVGYRKHESATTSRTGTLQSGNGNLTDLPEDETTTTDGAPWIEFADTLTFAGTLARTTQIAAEALIDTSDANAFIRDTQIAVEVLADTTDANADIFDTQIAVEVLYQRTVPSYRVVWIDDAEEQ